MDAIKLVFSTEQDGEISAEIDYQGSRSDKDQDSFASDTEQADKPPTCFGYECPELTVDQETQGIICLVTGQQIVEIWHNPGFCPMPYGYYRSIDPDPSSAIANHIRGRKVYNNSYLWKDYGGPRWFKSSAGMPWYTRLARIPDSPRCELLKTERKNQND